MSINLCEDYLAIQVVRRQDSLMNDVSIIFFEAVDEGDHAQFCTHGNQKEMTWLVPGTLRSAHDSYFRSFLSYSAAGVHRFVSRFTSHSLYMCYDVLMPNKTSS